MPYCTRCGQELEANARFCSRCGASVATGWAREDRLVENINVEYPAADSARLEIVCGVAHSIEVQPGASKFVEGTVEYEIPEWKPWIDSQDDTVRIEQQQSYLPMLRHDPFNRWKLNLGNLKPFSLSVRAGIGKGIWNLGGLPITSLRIETGAGENRFSFSRVNPQVMNDLEVRSGVGEIRLEGLLDANFGEMRISGAVGSIHLDFSGEKLRRDCIIHLEGGVGGVTIELPENAPARARIRGLTGVRSLGTFHRTGGTFVDSEYQTQAYNSGASPRMEFTLDMGVGGVTLRTIR